MSQKTYIEIVLEILWMRNYPSSITLIVKKEKINQNQCSQIN